MKISLTGERVSMPVSKVLSGKNLPRTVPTFPYLPVINEQCGNAAFAHSATVILKFHANARRASRQLSELFDHSGDRPCPNNCCMCHTFGVASSPLALSSLNERSIWDARGPRT